jgi:O-antigen/teichoic acid export membrane protein
MDKAAHFQRLICTKAIRTDLRRRSVRAAILTAGVGFADFAIRIVSTAILARLLLPEHFGLVMMVTAITAIAEQLRDFGLSTAIVQKKDLTHAEVSNLFWINVAAGTGIALLIGALAPLVSAYYQEPRLIVLTWALSITFILGGAMAQHQALLTRVLRLGHTSAVRLSASVLSTLLAIYLAWSGHGYWALVWREIARSALVATGMWLCLPWVPSLPSRQASVRGMLGFGANLTAANIVGTLGAAADRLLIGRFLGAASVGLFRQAHQLLATSTDQLVGPIYQVSQPGLSMLQNDPEKYRKFFRKMVSMVCLITMPLSLFAALYATELTALLLGPKWAEAAPLIAIFSIGTFIKQAVGSSALVLITLGRTQRLFFLSLARNVVLIVFMCIGVNWGIKGVAIAEVLTIYLLSAPRLYYSFANSPIDIGIFMSAVARPAISSVVMASILIAVRTLGSVHAPVPALLYGAGIATVSFYAAWLLLPGGRSELTALASDLVSAVRRKAIQPA